MRRRERLSMDDVVTWLNRNNINVLVVFATIVLLVATPLVIVALNRLLRRLVRRGERRLHLPYETVLMVTRVVTGGLWLITATLILSLWGLSVSGLWTLVISAIAVIGVGFLAVWTIVSNVTASFFITVWRPFNLGQTIEILPENLRGRVIDRNLMFTVLREEGGNLLQIPNNLFFQKVFRVIGGGTRSFFEYLESEDVAASAGPDGRR
jgi:small-conductance mechanosensitive channel